MGGRRFDYVWLIFAVMDGDCSFRLLLTCLAVEKWLVSTIEGCVLIHVWQLQPGFIVII